MSQETSSKGISWSLPLAILGWVESIGTIMKETITSSNVLRVNVRCTQRIVHGSLLFDDDKACSYYFERLFLKRFHFAPISLLAICHLISSVLVEHGAP